MSELASPIEEPLLPSPRRDAPREAPIWLMHSGMTAQRFVGMHTMGAIFPVTAGILLFGWRAIGAIGLVMTSAVVALLVWRKIGVRGRQLRFEHSLWLAMLLAIMLPAQLFVTHDPEVIAEAAPARWPILVAGGICLVMSTWLLGGLGSGRVHPVLVTYLLLFVCFKDLLIPTDVLQRKHLFAGDVTRAVSIEGTITQPWIRAAEIPGGDALRMVPASETLHHYTSAAESSNRAWLSLDAMLRDRMPPLEDLIVGGHPAPIGMGSAIAVIIGGLFLLYRGLIDYRVPLLIILSTAITALILPVPVVIRENEAVWKWLIAFSPGVVTTSGTSTIADAWSGWTVGLTLVNYELMAGPLLFMAFFLATSPAVRPIARRARVAYALIVGILAAVFQLYVSVAAGAYVALLLASALTPTFDKIFKPRTLV
jgi:Na+-translocating ferredoxin:NAD+ oxidoreductase RnfD subunit